MKDTQTLRLIRELKKRKVFNYEFASMHILAHTRRIKDIREKGIEISMDKVYGRDGKYHGVNQYWIPRRKDIVKKVMQYEEY